MLDTTEAGPLNACWQCLTCTIMPDDAAGWQLPLLATIVAYKSGVFTYNMCGVVWCGGAYF